MWVCWLIGHKYKQTKGMFRGFISGPVVCERCGKTPKRKKVEVQNGDEHTTDNINTS